MKKINNLPINMSKIKETLLRLGAISEKNISIYAKKTRDKGHLTVFRDSRSEVIFIDNYYVGADEYIKGDYRNTVKPLMKTAERDYEDLLNSDRRFSTYQQFIAGRGIVDFGCGMGSFLKRAKLIAKYTAGVELEQYPRDTLNNDGIPCYGDLSLVPNNQDTIFAFHCLEHLPDPSDTLAKMHQKLKTDGAGKIIIEVPHARDFLINTLPTKAFIEFTLWSQHLILHTRESLKLLLSDAGFKNIQIHGVQRYGLTNHMNWLSKGLPGGHKEILSTLESKDLVAAYADALGRIDANDTLVAIAET